MRAPWRHLAILAVGGLVLAGCGSDDEKGKSAASSAASTPTAPPTAPPTATRPPAQSTNPGGAEHSARERDNGGEEPVRSDAAFVVSGARLIPRTISVPAFIAVDLRVRNRDGRRHVIVVRADRAYRLVVPPAARGSRLVPGQRAGTYPVLVDGRRRGAVEFGGEPGP